jgi:hypothetical protein
MAGGISVDKSALDKAGKYLNTTAAGPDDAKLSRYGIKSDDPADLTATAAGLLCREQLGWEQDNADLAAGCAWLLENLPRAGGSGSMPYYFFATQTLHNREGNQWDQWNHHMREYLLGAQEKGGDLEGSWKPAGDDASKSNRLSATSMALLTLESYYRHLPLYKRTKVTEAK